MADSESKIPPEFAEFEGPPAQFGCGGAALALIVYCVTMGAVMESASHLETGGNARPVVGFPWPLFVSLPTVISFAVVLCGFRFRQRSSRLSWMLWAGVTIVLCTLLGVDLLDRAYRGKF